MAKPLRLLGPACLWLAASPAFAGPLTLAECLRIAEKNSPKVQAAAERLERSVQARKQGLAAFSPQVDLGLGQILAGYDETGVVRRSPSFDDASSRASIDGRLNLFNSGQDLLAYRQSRDQASADARGLAAEKEQAALDAAQAYFGLLLARRTLKVRADGVAARREHLATAKTLFRSAVRSYSDVLQAQIALRDAEILLAEAESAMKLAGVRLNILLGLSSLVPMDVADVGPIAEEPRGLEESIEAAQESKPEVLALEFETRRQRSAYHSAVLSALPSLKLDGGYTLRLDQAKTEFAPTQQVFSPNPYWRVDLSMRVPLWDGLFSFREARKSRSSLRAAEWQAAQARREAALAALEAYVEVERHKRVYELSKEQSAAARQSAQLIQERYKLGATTFLEVIDSQSALSRLELQEVYSLYRYHASRLTLRRAVGQPLEGA